MYYYKCLSASTTTRARLVCTKKLVKYLYKKICTYELGMWIEYSQIYI